MRYNNVNLLFSLLCCGRFGEVSIVDFEAPVRTDFVNPWEHEVYNAPSGQYHKGMVTGCQFYPIDSGSFCTGGQDSTIRLWSSETLHVVDYSKQESPIQDLHWGKAQQTGGVIALAIGSHAVRLIDPRTRHDLQHMRWPNKHVQSVRFGEVMNCPYVFAGSNHGEVVVWDIR